jgi:hypothetical protein
MTTSPVLVLQTYYVDPGRYEVEVAPVAWKPRLKLVTFDPQVYRDCLDCEGRDVRVVITYHRAGADDVIDSIDPAPGVR